MTRQQPAEPVIRLHDVHRTYPGTPPVQALKPCNLSVRDGDYVAITGSSGSGKSTLLNVLGLLDEATGGTYLLREADVSRLREADRATARARHIGFVSQTSHLMSDRTAGENVELAMLYAATPLSERRARARTALTRVGVGHRTSALAPTLSGGERQRVAIARALAPRASVLLCDEPTGSLDTATSAAVLDLMDMLNEEGITVVVATCDEQVGVRARRVLHIRDGRLTELPSGGVSGREPSGTETR